MCKCHCPLYHVGQDESIFKAFLYSSSQWIIKGVRGVRKKTEGPGEMVSAMQDEIRGFGFPTQQHYTMGYTVCYIKTFVLRLCNHFCVIIV